MATVVLDNGAYSAKIGYITEVIPRLMRFYSHSIQFNNNTT